MWRDPTRSDPQHASEILAAAADKIWNFTARSLPGRAIDGGYDAAVTVSQYHGVETHERLVEALRSRVRARHWVTVNHHYSHALGAFFDSPFYHNRVPREQESGTDVTLILSFDGYRQRRQLQLLSGPSPSP